MKNNIDIVTKIDVMEYILVKFPWEIASMILLSTVREIKQIIVAAILSKRSLGLSIFMHFKSYENAELSSLMHI